MNRRDQILKELDEALREREPATGRALRAAQREYRHTAPSRPLFPRLLLAGTSLALASAVGLSVLTHRTTTTPIVTRPIGARERTRTHPVSSLALKNDPHLPQRLGGTRVDTRKPRVQVGSSDKPITDDLTFLNEGASTDAYANRSAGFVRSDADGFVEVPLPQLAAESKAANAAAIRVYQDEKAIQDPRLQRRVTIAKKAVSFGQLLEQLAKETSIDISATRGVADDKLTVFCKDKPLRDLLRQITQHFGFVWERTGTDPAYAYRLKQPLRNQFLEEELRNKDRNEALLALDREMEDMKKHFDLSPDQARAAAEHAEGKEKEHLDALGGLGWGPSRLYFGLSNEEHDTLLAGKPLSFGDSGMAGNNLSYSEGHQALPPALAQSVLNSLAGHAFIEGDSIHMYSDRDQASKDKVKGKSPAEAGAQPSAQLRLQRNELGQFTLEGMSGFSNGGSSALGGTTLAVGISPSASSPKNAEANAAKKKLPAYQKATELTEPPVSDDRKERKWTSADLLEKLHKATGKDVIGDYFTRLAPAKSEKGNLFEVLTRTCDPLRLRWDEKEGWLTFRSTDFFNMRLKEVPNRLLEKWAAQRQKARSLSSDDVREFSRLSNDQLDSSTMAEGAKLLYGLEEWSWVRGENIRELWRFYDGLPTALRTAMASEKGLRFSQMGLDARQKYLKAAYAWETELLTALQEGSADEAFLKRLEERGSLRLVVTREGAPERRSIGFTFRCPIKDGALLEKTLSPTGSSSHVVR